MGITTLDWFFREKFGNIILIMVAAYKVGNEIVFTRYFQQDGKEVVATDPEQKLTHKFLHLLVTGFLVSAHFTHAVIVAINCNYLTCPVCTPHVYTEAQ